MLCSASSLLYISFLDQAIGRSCRYLTVVIVGVYFSRLQKNSQAKLPPQKIVTALVITVGVLSFSIFGVLWILFRIAQISLPMLMLKMNGKDFSFWLFQLSQMQSSVIAKHTQKQTLSQLPTSSSKLSIS